MHFYICVGVCVSAFYMCHVKHCRTLSALRGRRHGRKQSQYLALGRDTGCLQNPVLRPAGLPTSIHSHPQDLSLGNTFHHCYSVSKILPWLYIVNYRLKSKFSWAYTAFLNPASAHPTPSIPPFPLSCPPLLWPANPQGACLCTCSSFSTPLTHTAPKTKLLLLTHDGTPSGSFLCLFIMHLEPPSSR